MKFTILQKKNKFRKIMIQLVKQEHLKFVLKATNEIFQEISRYFKGMET